ncbi:hypothetical protein MBLNU230_g7641t1 [Neophaeotheca triangularis]
MALIPPPPYGHPNPHNPASRRQHLFNTTLPYLGPTTAHHGGLLWLQQRQNPLFRHLAGWYLGRDYGYGYDYGYDYDYNYDYDYDYDYGYGYDYGYDRDYGYDYDYGYGYGYDYNHDHDPSCQNRNDFLDASAAPWDVVLRARLEWELRWGGYGWGSRLGWLDSGPRSGWLDSGQRSGLLDSGWVVIR